VSQIWGPHQGGLSLVEQAAQQIGNQRFEARTIYAGHAQSFAAKMVETWSKLNFSGA
jgi:hypothetical protein